MEVGSAWLGGQTAREFLERYWQKAPLLVRGALPGFALPFGAAHVAALACDPGVASRLVTAPRAGRNWTTRRGPLAEGDITALPDEGWTILLHEMDRRFAELADLLERFRFVPNWRVDDVMVSYATDGGGVGPHIDRYDVFLLQAHGRRRWRVGAAPLRDERFVPDVEHGVLRDFEPAEEQVLEPGDLLYLPPRWPHDGIAEGPCMTCSIGFRAPDPRELCSGYLRQLGPEVFDGVRYADPDLVPATNAGELPAAARRRLRASALELFERRSDFDRWVGRFVTTPARGTCHGGGTALRAEDLRRLLEQGHWLRRSAPPHFAWYADDRDAAGVVRLFAGGEEYRMAAGRESVAELLCGRTRLDRRSLGPFLEDPSFVDVLRDLLLRGLLQPQREAN